MNNVKKDMNQITKKRSILLKKIYNNIKKDKTCLPTKFKDLHNKQFIKYLQIQIKIKSQHLKYKTNI